MFSQIDIDRMWEAIIAVATAAAGGMAQMLYYKDKKRLKAARVASELFISAFTGWMALKLCRVGGLENDIVGLVCGIAGWTSPKILFAVTRIVESVLKIDDASLGHPKEGGKQ